MTRVLILAAVTVAGPAHLALGLVIALNGPHWLYWILLLAALVAANVLLAREGDDYSDLDWPAWRRLRRYYVSPLVLLTLTYATLAGNWGSLAAPLQSPPGEPLPLVRTLARFAFDFVLDSTCFYGAVVLHTPLWVYAVAALVGLWKKGDFR